HRVWAAARPPGVTVLRRRAHVVDLEQGFDAVWKHGFSSRARNHVRRAERAALARARARRRDPPGKLRHLLADLGGAARLWLAWSADGRPAAAILVLQTANAHYTRGAIDAEVAGPTRAAYLLHRLAIEDAC